MILHADRWLWRVNPGKHAERYRNTLRVLKVTFGDPGNGNTPDMSDVSFKGSRTVDGSQTQRNRQVKRFIGFVVAFSVGIYLT